MADPDCESYDCVSALGPSYWRITQEGFYRTMLHRGYIHLVIYPEWDGNFATCTLAEFVVRRNLDEGRYKALGFSAHRWPLDLDFEFEKAVEQRRLSVQSRLASLPGNGS